MSWITIMHITIYCPSKKKTIFLKCTRLIDFKAKCGKLIFRQLWSSFMLNVLIDNICVTFSGFFFQQTIGIQLWLINCRLVLFLACGWLQTRIFRIKNLLNRQTSPKKIKMWWLYCMHISFQTWDDGCNLYINIK